MAGASPVCSVFNRDLNFSIRMFAAFKLYFSLSLKKVKMFNIMGSAYVNINVDSLFNTDGRLSVSCLNIIFRLEDCVQTWNRLSPLAVVLDIHSEMNASVLVMIPTIFLLKSFLKNCAPYK